MKGLQDNAGEYDANRKLEDFSVDFLANLAREYARTYLATDGFWNGAVTQRVGAKEALDCELLVWERIAEFVIPRIAELTNIRLPVKDIFEAVKLFQINPQNVTPDIFKISYEVKDKNCAVGTVTYCAALERYEKSAPEIIETLCHKVEVAAAEAQVRILHPRMKMTALKLPPRKSPDEIACQWEFKIEE